MAITWDPDKRARTLQLRGLDFADAEKVFAGVTAEREDTRQDYGKRRIVTAGYLGDRFVVIVWTPRDDDRRIISMRQGHADEEAQFWD